MCGNVENFVYLRYGGAAIEQVANAISVSAWRLFAVIDGGDPMTADLDLLLTKYFGMPEWYFLRMQKLYNLRLA